MKNTIRYIFLLAILSAAPLLSSAQLSIMPAATYNRYLGQSKSDPSLYGFNLTLGVDFGEKSQISAGYTWNSRYEWKRLETPVHELNWNLPRRVDNPNNMIIREWTFHYTYFFSGDNVTFTSFYASAGPSIMMRAQNGDPSGSIVQKRNDYHLDMRVGATGHIGIGWMFIEGRIAPRVFSAQRNGGLPTWKGPLYGVNTGVRFLLNRHPRCSY